MTVYVDNQNAYGRIVRGGRTVTGMWSRLLADDPVELAEFAANLGLPPEWVRAAGTPAESYDVGDLTRRRAIAAGAVPITYPRGTGNVIATNTLQAAALDAAGRDWHVFPLRPGTKIPAIRDWEHAATADPEEVRSLWTAGLRLRDGWFVPEPRNLGIACGPSQLIVLDLDVAKADRTGWAEVSASLDAASGVEVLTRLAEQAGQALPDTYTVATPSRGRHLYFTAPEEVQVRNSAGRVGPMIDVRGKGGYVVGPGSRIHPHYYEPQIQTIDHGEPGYQLITDLDPATLPDWIADAATASRSRDDQADTGPGPERGRVLGGRSAGYGAAALRGEVDWVRSAPVGERNHRLNGAAYSLGQLVAADALDRADIVAALTDAAQAAGLPPSEIAATIDSGLRAGANHPRRLPPARAEHTGGASQASATVDQPERAVARRDFDGVTVEGDLDRVFGLEPAVALPIVAGLIIDAPADDRPVLLRDAASWIARLVYDDAIDGQYALDALSAAAGRVGMTRAEVETAIRAGFARSQDPADGPPPPATAEADADDPAARRSGPPQDLDRPVDSDALVRDLLAVLQSKEVIDRATWDAAVTAAAERSAAAQREEADVRRTDSVDAADAARTRQPDGDDAGNDHASNSTTVAAEPAATRSRGSDDTDDPEKADRPDDPSTTGATAARALREAAFAVAEARISGDGSVTDAQVDQLTGAAYAALDAWTQPAPDPTQEAEADTSETPTDDTAHTDLPGAKARSQAAPEEHFDVHADLDDAIGHARAAVAHAEARRAATRNQPGADAPDAAVHTDRPAYWTDPEIEL